MSNTHKLARSGSKEVKHILVETQNQCYICNCQSKLTLHHICLIRHGFTTKLNYSILLCPECHSLYHTIFDIELDELFATDPFTNFALAFERQTEYIRYLLSF